MNRRRRNKNVCYILFLGMVFINGSSQDEIPAKDRRFKLHSGSLMPMVGFGTYLIQGDDLVKTSLDYALGAGYRLIDSATIYGNEESIGKALKQLLPKHKLKREDIFITSKLSPSDQGEAAYNALKESLRKLDCGYLDLYLIHWPGTFTPTSNSTNNAKLRAISWQQLTKGIDDGLVKNIGVSNYNVRHLNELLASNPKYKPAVNQVEWHPHYYQNELKELCDREGILLQAYSSLGGSGNTDLLKNAKVVNIAKKLGKSPAQVLLRWPLQNNIAIIPKARSKQHIEDNIELNFDIPEEDMKTLNEFKQTKYSWNPDAIA